MAPLHLANPLHCNGVALDASGTPGAEIEWKGCAAHEARRSESAPLQNVYVGLQNRQNMTCLEADVHVWMGGGDGDGRKSHLSHDVAPVPPTMC